MKAKVLKHKTKKGYYGVIRHGILCRTGTKIEPELFPADCNKDWLQQLIIGTDCPFVNSLDEFDLIDVELILSKE